MTVVANRVYVAGARTEDPPTLDLTFDLLRQRQGIAWIGLYRPDPDELEAVAAEFELPRLAVDDAIAAHQRPKLERYGSVLFVVLRPARYLEPHGDLDCGELHLFVGPQFVVTIRHAETPDLAAVRRRLEDSPELLTLGTEAILYAILDQVVDEYAPVVQGLQSELDGIDDRLFTDDDAVARDIYASTGEVIEFQRAVTPLLEMTEALHAGFEKYHVDERLQHLLRDVRDHCIRVAERAAGFRSQLRTALTTHNTLVTQRQSTETQRLTEASVAQGEQVKKISSWGAILFAPTLVGTVYGMNFDHIPELHWTLGYPFALLLMVATSLTLYLVFKRRNWL